MQDFPSKKILNLDFPVNYVFERFFDTIIKVSEAATGGVL